MRKAGMIWSKPGVDNQWLADRMRPPARSARKTNMKPVNNSIKFYPSLPQIKLMNLERTPQQP